MLYIGKEKSLFIAKKLRNEFIYNMAKLEGNTLSFAEAETVIYGTSIAGKRMSELHQIENIRDAWNEVINQVENKEFNFRKYNFCYINSIVARGENNDAIGGFRKENVAISGTEYMPPMPLELNLLFDEMHIWINKDSLIAEKALDLFMEASRTQFFGDGNKRTSQLMMNGILMSEGYSPITINPKDEVEYRTLLINYYETNNKEEFREFLYKQQEKIMDRFQINKLQKEKIPLVGQTQKLNKKFRSDLER